MRTLTDKDEDVPIRSDFSTEPAERVMAEDEEDFNTLKQVFVLIREAEKKSDSMSTLVVGHPTLSMEQQVAAYQFALDEVITPIKTLLMDTIGEIKLKQRGINNG